MDQGTLKVILYFNTCSSLANGKNKEYLIDVFKHWAKNAVKEHKTLEPIV